MPELNKLNAVAGEWVAKAESDLKAACSVPPEEIKPGRCSKPFEFVTF
jgi:hypothetical protein